MAMTFFLWFSCFGLALALLIGSVVYAVMSQKDD